MPRLCFYLTALCQAMAGCQPARTVPALEPVHALVAASAKDAVGDIAALFTAETGTPVTVIAESSSRLARQIGEGAPGDLFLSASDDWADFVAGKGFAAEIKPLLRNELVLIVPKGNPAGIARARDLGEARVEHVALAGPQVPAGVYARQALAKEGLLESLERAKKIAAGEDVRATLAFVERGEAEAGIVYATDALLSDRVRVVEHFDPTSHSPIRYPLVLLKAGAARAPARAFFEWLQSQRAGEVFQKYGFDRASEK